MTRSTRRTFIQALGGTAILGALPIGCGGGDSDSSSSSNSAAKVVIVGGGFAGSTVAKYLKMWSTQSISVTLIDPSPSHVSCVLSNLVLNDQIDYNDLLLSHQPLQNYGVKVIQDRVVSINNDGKKLVLNSGSTIQYDRLVLATGISLIELPGTDFNLTPHAWIAGEQTKKLASMVQGLNQGETFVMTVPKAPYRCPPGPYERACLVADVILRQGWTSGDTKVIVLDENDSIQAEKATFESAFNDLYPNIIEYIPGVTVESVESQNNTVITDVGDYVGDVVNFIPRHQALDFIREVGLTQGGDWAGVDTLTYESIDNSFSDIYIIGDSQASNQPKSGHIANSQAKICADAIIRSLEGLSILTTERINNITTNSACYSPITYNKASWLTANFRYNVSTGEMELIHIGEADQWTNENYQQMFSWTENLFSDSFK